MRQDVHLFVATPCFGGQVSSIFATSLLKLQQVAGARTPPLPVRVVMRPDDALITRARATLLAAFLDDPQATHLLFIYADIGFEPDQVMRLLDFDADVTAAIYPVKKMDWDKIRVTLDAKMPDPAAASLHYVMELANPAQAEARNGFVKVRYAGTGFLMIRREAVERMCARHPELKYKNDHSSLGAADNPHRYALFECMIDPVTGTYLSEDFAFCKRWTDMGGEIWADLHSRLSHVGSATFSGDFSTQFNL